MSTKPSQQLIETDSDEESEIPIPKFEIPFLENEESLKVIDDKIAKIIKSNPNAYILPRLNVEVSKEWEKNHKFLETATIIGEYNYVLATRF